MKNKMKAVQEKKKAGLSQGMKIGQNQLAEETKNEIKTGQQELKNEIKAELEERFSTMDDIIVKVEVDVHQVKENFS